MDGMDLMGWVKVKTGKLGGKEIFTIFARVKQNF
jgi:hypothetical protein